MQYNLDNLPVPYLTFNRDAEITGYSREAINLFDMEDRKLIHLVDEDSIEKLYKIVFAKKAGRNVELNLITRQEPLSLFEVQFNWDQDGICHFIAIPADKANSELAARLSELQNRLSSTDFELFEKKEQLEDAISRLNQLSGPFIPVSDVLAFVPLFGDLTEAKMKAVTANAVKSAYEGEYETILFDFNATGKITAGGIAKLHDLFQLLIYMGNPTIKVIGVKPSHAKELNRFGQSWPVQFEPSLRTALNQYIQASSAGH